MDGSAVFSPQQVLSESIQIAEWVNSAIPAVMAELRPLTTPTAFASGMNYAVQVEMLNAEWINVIAPSLTQLLPPP